MKRFRGFSKAGLAVCLLLLFVGLLAIAAIRPEGSIVASFATLPLVFGMIGQTTGTVKTVKCTASVTAAFTIAKPGADDDTYSLSSAATDALLGIFQHTTSAANAAVELMISGVSPVVYGGAVTRGDPLTSDGSGKAVKATLGQSVIGYATVSGVLNDIGFCIISPQTLSPVQASSGNTFKGLAIATFDPSAVAGQRTVAKHGLGVYLPDNAIATRTFYEVLTTFTSANDSGTVALGADTDAEAGIKAAVAISDGTNPYDAGLHEGIQDGAAANFLTKLTAERELCATVAVQALTAGKARIYVEYVVSI